MAVAHINTDIAALKAVYQLGLNSRQVNKTFEQISSGYRINRASDDPVGYAIAVGMQQDIRTIRQAGMNAETGINVLRTAESALSTIQEHLLRMRELSVQGASDTSSAAARKSIAKEIRSLADEVDRLSQVAEFNGQKLLDGTVTTALVHVGTTQRSRWQHCRFSQCPTKRRYRFNRWWLRNY
ncbi:MAG: flagellin [Vampirovibrionales bacterium]